MARYWRMRGKRVFYPMGWDDNGLATERRVENYFGVRCEPALALRPRLRAPRDAPGDEAVRFRGATSSSSASNSPTLDEQVFKNIWRHLGISIDWSLEYSTISRARPGRLPARLPRAAGARRGRLLGGARLCGTSTSAPRSPRPSWWTASGPRATTASPSSASTAPAPSRSRPPGPSCCPAAWRSSPTPTTRATPTWWARACSPRSSASRCRSSPTSWPTPRRAPASPWSAPSATRPTSPGGASWASPRAPSSGATGGCSRSTFGEGDFASRDAASANAHYAQVAGRTVNQARAAVVDQLRQSGALVGEPRAITHPVKFYEKGERPLEIVTSRQWFISTLAHRAELLARGDELTWHPDFMRHRYRSWVEGLNLDWNISRQRYFGVPFPVWYRVDEHGEVLFDAPLVPALEALPVDPSSEAPAGYDEAQRGAAGGLRGRPRRHGHLGHQLAHPRDRRALGQRPLRAGLPHGPASPGPRHHPHLALLERRARPLPPRRAAVAPRGDLGVDLGPGAQEDEQVRRQRGDPDAAARGPRRRRPALLGGQRAPRRGHRHRRGPDEGRPAPGHQGAERLEVRARGASRVGPSRDRRRSPSRSTSTCCACWATW